MPVASSQVARKASPYQAVREVLDAAGEKGGYDLKEIERITDEIAELVRRIGGIHTVSERFRNVTLSPYVTAMLKLAGKHRLVESGKP